MRGAAAAGLTRGGPAIAAAVFMVAITLQSTAPRAELLFRSSEQINGQQQWSSPRNYADPSDTADLRAPAEGMQVMVDEVQVSVQGNITAADVYGARVMESLLKKGRQRIAGNLVSFSSSGGEVDAAMELGRILRKLGVTALVAEGELCLSSCVFAFMGGDRRTVAGRLGIHRPYFSLARDVPDRRSHYRQLQKRLQLYIEELDFPPSLYEAVMAVPPQSVNMLTSAELKRFYLEGMSPSAEDEADAASARGLGVSVAEYLLQKGQALPCAGVAGDVSRCDGPALKAAGGVPAAGYAVAQPANEAARGNPAVGRSVERK